MVHSRFRGEIVGVGSRSGVRIVVGRWRSSPLGAFADAMVETADGHRVLLAPSRQVAEFVATTYSFDSVRIEEVRVDVTPDGSWSVRSASLVLDVAFGRRTLLGQVLRLVPARIAESPTWCTVTDPVARVVLRGVRTRGSAGGGRQEWYGATDHHAVTGLRGSFDGVDVGELRPVLPAPRFGFSSTPAAPSITRVVTTVSGRGTAIPDDDHRSPSSRGQGMFAFVAATDAERATPRAGDELIAPADVVMDRAFTLAAPPSQVWPWLAQLGKKRAGWYLPAGLERFLPVARRAAWEIHDRWQHLEVGDSIPDYGGKDETFQVAHIEPPTSIVYTSQRGSTKVTWSITVEPAVGGTRVFLRLRMAPVRRRWLAGTVGELVDVLTIAGMAAGLRQRLSVQPR